MHKNILLFFTFPEMFTYRKVDVLKIACLIIKNAIHSSGRSLQQIKPWLTYAKYFMLQSFMYSLCFVKNVASSFLQGGFPRIGLLQNWNW